MGGPTRSSGQREGREKKERTEDKRKAGKPVIWKAGTGSPFLYLDDNLNWTV